MKNPLVGIVMGSRSDWTVMQNTIVILQELEIRHECRVISAHRTPGLMMEYATSAESRGLEVIIAGAGGAAHLPGMVASLTNIPVLGVPTVCFIGTEALLSIVQMPAGTPVGTLGVGKSGAINAAILAAEILGNKYQAIRTAVSDYKRRQSQEVLNSPKEFDG